MTLETPVDSPRVRDVFVIAAVVLSFLFQFGTALAVLEEATPDPLPTPIIHGGLTVELIEIASLPGEPEQSRRSRINYLFHAGDDSGRLFVSDMGGKIYIVKNGSVFAEPFLDIAEIRGSAFLAKEFELGLGSFAFHPSYSVSGKPGSGKLYTVHSEKPTSVPDSPNVKILKGTGRTTHHYDVVMEWTVDTTDRNLIDPLSGREVLRIAQPWWDHNTGLIAFNPNADPDSEDFGLLYIGVGDGGNTANRSLDVDADRQGQDLISPLGKILRINPLQRGNRPYTTPDNNPFSGSTGALSEIWAYGFRNPQRFSWDTGGTNKMLVGDIGQAQIEEINVVVAGGNYGWSEKEGIFLVNHDDQRVLLGDTTNRNSGRFIDPVVQYDHDEGIAVVGGFVYRGRATPALRGKYVFGDIVRGRLFYSDVADMELGRQVPVYELLIEGRHGPQRLRDVMGNPSRADLRFGLDQDGELYLLTKQDGVIRKVQGVPGDDASYLPVSEPTGSVASDTHFGNGGSMFTWLIYLGGTLLVLLGAGVFFLSAKRKGHLPHGDSDVDQTGHGPEDCYHSSLSNYILEIDDRRQLLVVKEIVEEGGGQVIPFGELIAARVTVNGKVIVTISEGRGTEFDQAMEEDLTTRLLELEKEPMRAQSVRQIDLLIFHGRTDRSMLTVNFYYREGNRRLTRYSYAATTEHIMAWCKHLARAFASHAHQRPELLSATGLSDSEQMVENPNVERVPIAATARSDLADELGKLAELWEKGVLTDEEFKKSKARIIDPH